MKKRQYSFYAAFLFLFISGLVWLGAHYLLRSQGEFGDVISPIEPLSLKLHGAAVMIASFAAGAMLPGHANLHWRRGRNKLAGIWMIGSLIFLAVTGWILYYAVNEENQNLVSMAHWIVGLSMLPVIFWHRLAGLYSRRTPH